MVKGIQGIVAKSLLEATQVFIRVKEGRKEMHGVGSVKVSAS